MSSSVFRSISPIFLVGVVLCLACPAQAFGAGNIPEASGFDGYNWRHGDIVDTLLLLPMSLITKRAFMPIDVSRVYFGNWMRDYSQFMDVGLLSGVPEPVLRAFVSILGFMEFGYATQEFDVTKDRIGVYRPEEHIGKRFNVMPWVLLTGLLIAHRQPQGTHINPLLLRM